MEIAEIRDFILCVSFGLMVIFLVLINVLGFLLYQKVKSAATAIQSTINTTKQAIAETMQAVNSAKEMGGVVKKQETETDRLQREDLGIKK